MSILDSVGNTSMIKLDGICVKLEHLNPSGSVKGRIVKYIVEKAGKSGQLKKDCILTGETGT